MKFTPEQIEKAKSAKSAEELIALAKTEGIEATEEEIKAQFAAMHNEGELADEELGNVSGGCGGPDPKYHAGQRVCFRTPDGEDLYGTIESSYYVELQHGYYYWISMDNGERMKFALESEYCAAKVIG